MKSRNLSGFALPTVLIASIVMLTVLLMSVTSTVAVRVALQTQYLAQLSQTASDAGVAYAKACLAANNGVPLWTDANPLTPYTDCSGLQTLGFTCLTGQTLSTDTRCSVTTTDSGTGIQASFSVKRPATDSNGKATNVDAAGSVKVLRTSDNSIWRQYNQENVSKVSNSPTIQVLVVGGGGGGGSDSYSGGGGGGGEYRYISSFSVASQSYPVVIGSGGSGSRVTASGATSGGISSFSTIIADGGGPGGDGYAVSRNGASGGGGGYGASVGGTGSQGNNGGSGTSSGNYPSGGGGGSGAAGSNGSGSVSGNGGIGTMNTISGTATYYAGGGGGSGSVSWGSTPGSGGLGGGGNGTTSANGNAGTANTGGGGGAAGNNANAGGAGGSGVVIVSYPTGSMTATGGTITTAGLNTVHTFTGSGVFSVVPNVSSVKVLVVGGGGGGGTSGGGGAGGVIYQGAFAVSNASYSIVVGTGGASQNNGTDSSFSTLTAVGGGRGSNGGTNGYDGGSGGGGGENSGGPTYGGNANYTPIQQGYNGGGNGAYVASPYPSGGGGGAGGLGGSGTGAAISGNGGIGLSYSINGSSVCYAGGGGGGIRAGGTAGTATCGGGAGSNNSSNAGTAASASTGGGGGGGSSTSAGGQGGSGIVIISYPTGSMNGFGGTITYTDSNNQNSRSGTPFTGGYTIHTFTSSGAFGVGVAAVKVLVVAGGGGGGTDRAGAGGGGGVVYQDSYIVDTKSYPVTVGVGGYGSIACVVSGNGKDSIFGTLTAAGGGGGGTGCGDRGAIGGSGGGGGNNTTCYPCAGGTGFTGQGNSGGYGVYVGANYGGGGGGGAGGAGGNGTSTASGNGGVGLAYSISGSSVYYGGGGGAGSYGSGGTNGVGGLGGGGNGSQSSAASGTPNTGGGGGSSGNAAASGGGSGGSGIVIISYPTGAISATGGIMTTSGGYTIHTFNSSGAFVVGPSAPIQILVVAGGGGGGNSGASGGGGGGGVVYNASYLVRPQTYAVTVGNGGAATVNGDNSVFDSIIAYGGGAGALDNGANGGNGGGSARAASTTTRYGFSILGQGYNGGMAGYYSGQYPAAGGGGSGGLGGSATSASPGTSGAGGIGRLSTISGTSTYYSGGGGGGGDYCCSRNLAPNTGGNGGGGAGGNSTNGNGVNGAANTGGGGGGATQLATSVSGTGGTGGSGIVIISYPTGLINATGTGSGYTVITSGGRTIHTFTSSGTFVVSSVVSPSSSNNLLNNLVSYWKLDETSGNANDIVGNNTMINNGTTPFVASKLSNGANFNGSSQYFRSSDYGFPSGFGNLSISAWVNITNYADQRNVLTYGTRANNQSLCFGILSTGVLWVDMYNEGKGSTTTVSAGSWHHVAVTITGKNLQFYLDGTAIQSATFVNTPNKVLSGNAYIGINNDATTQKMYGSVDEVGIWSRALTSAEVTALYNSGSGLSFSNF